MPKYSTRSKTELMTCHPKLQRVFNEVVKHYDCTILEGRRDRAEQNKLYREGKSQLQWPDSEHNTERVNGHSRAVDVAPYPIEWNDEGRFYHFAGAVMVTAKRLRIKLRWGGDWDQDGFTNDNGFDDLVHFELDEEED